MYFLFSFSHGIYFCFNFSISEQRETPNIPCILHPLVNQTLRTGKTATLTCRVRCIPPGKIRWYKNGQKIKSGNRYQLLASKHQAYRLMIHNVDEEDTGLYQMAVENEYGRASTECMLTVKGGVQHRAPFVEKSLEDVRTNVGSKVILKCKITGQPNPSIIWLKDGQKLKSSRDIQLNFDDNNCMLIIHSATVENTGLYACSATNLVGTVSTECRLLVEGKFYFYHNHNHNYNIIDQGPLIIYCPNTKHLYLR
ncbi:putative immunoglobulin I-set domain protein [Trichinella nativa]|uniref:Putative immunoglobulin I-set domain protein n=1 Tax=Trichinella nativa TaxID=6335 RepID=A0A1Y3E8P3_9BILA|nr:putative immunoglobulin I-set domain protein [Trichinella nativa]